MIPTFSIPCKNVTHVASDPEKGSSLWFIAGAAIHHFDVTTRLSIMFIPLETTAQLTSLAVMHDFLVVTTENCLCLASKIHKHASSTHKIAVNTLFCKDTSLAFVSADSPGTIKMCTASTIKSPDKIFTDPKKTTSRFSSICFDDRQVVAVSPNLACIWQREQPSEPPTYLCADTEYVGIQLFHDRIWILHMTEGILVFDREENSTAGNLPGCLLTYWQDGFAYFNEESSTIFLNTERQQSSFQIPEGAVCLAATSDWLAICYQNSVNVYQKETSSCSIS